VKVLLVAHYFPPDGGAGSQRPASFAQHLPRLGVELRVVCRSVDDRDRNHYDPKDGTLSERTRDAVVRRTARRDGEDWTAALLRETRAAVAEDRPDLLLVTISPFEHAAIGPAIRREFGIPHVLDLRDPWALDGWLIHRHWFAWRRALGEMGRAVRRADGVVMNVPEARAVVERHFPRTGLHPYGVVTNGWEEDDFGPLDPVEPADALRLRFAGSFFCRFIRWRSPLRRLRSALFGRGERLDERGRSPLFVLEAIRRLRERNSPAGTAVKLEVAGFREPEVDLIVAESGCADAFEHVGYLSHDQSTRFISGADVLLLPMQGLPPGARARMVPGKLYEYFATGRPILGLCPEGDARDWIGGDPRSRVAAPTDPEAIADAIESLHADWREGLLRPSLRTPIASEFTRAMQARRLHEYLRGVLSDRRS
jgi:glycosyltransferase involved in cell wall biosynthesis